MHKKKLCIILPEHYSSNLGGAEYQCKLLLEALCSKNKYDIYYLCYKARSGYEPENYTIRIIRRSSFLRPLGGLAYARNLYVELKKIRPEVIYQNVGGIQTGIAALYSKNNGIKFIWHIASDDDVENQWKGNLSRNLRLAPERFFLNYGIRNSSEIVAQTKYQAQLLKRKFNIECNRFIPIGHPIPNERIRKSKTFSILWIANIKPLKRPEVFVKLAKKFHNFSNVRFQMIGSPGWGNWFQNLKSDIETMANLDYLGQLSQDEVNGYLGKSHLLVNTSRYEGFSNTFVQAWMREVPVVSLSVDPDDIIVKEGMGFKSQTFDQLCRDLRTLIEDDKLRKQMGTRAYDYAIRNHTSSKMVDCAFRLFG